MKTLLSHPNIVDERHQVKDLLNFEHYVNNLKVVADSSAQKSLIGIVGNYGIGKSVMLHTFQQKYAQDDSVHWIHFDAWKYPDRSNLWEGFVLDFVQQYDKKRFDSVLKKIDGKRGDAPAALAKGTAGLANIVIPGIGAGLGELLAHFTATSPAKRVFEVQALLEDLLKKNGKKRIYIVVEDADRSGVTGIYFIETLNQFLKNFPLDIEIKVFIPIARSSFDSPEQHATYIKALDVVEFFQLSSQDMKHFVETVFHPKVLKPQHYTHYFTELLQRLMNNYGLTIREVKFIVRNSENKFQKLRSQKYAADPLITVLLEATRYIKLASSDTKFAYDLIREERHIPQGNIIATMLYALHHEITVDAMVDLINQTVAPMPTHSPIYFAKKYNNLIDASTRTVLPAYTNPNYYLAAFYIDQ